MEQLKLREELPKETTWNLEAMFENDDLWEEEYRRLQSETAEIKELKGVCAADTAKMKDVLDRVYAVRRRASHLFIYAKMRYDQDTGNPFYKKLLSKAETLSIALRSSLAFLEPEILSIGKETVEQAIKKTEGLEFYRRAIEEIFSQSAHTGSAEVEALLSESNSFASVPQNIFTIFMNADLTFPDAVLADGTKIPVNNSNFVPLLESENREVRKAVFDTYYQTLKSYENTIAAMFEGNLKQALFYAKSRKYDTSRQMYLDQNHIPETVYDNLIDAVHEALPSMYRYVSVRKKMLGVETLHMYDVYTPIVKPDTASYSFEQAKKIVKEGLAPMGEEYLNIVQKGFDSRWIDVYPNKGKTTGAYSFGSYDSDPYIQLNYQGTLDNVFTTAHEMGHSLHSYFSNHTQPYVYSKYRIFVAEVASTCNESLLIHHMLKNCTSKKERIYLLNHFLDTIKGTIFRQTMFAEFERETHRMCQEEIPLTADVLSDLYHKLNQTYFGPDMVSDEGIAMEWARIPHFYRPFYVYQYATGLSAAIALSGRILELGEPAVQDYLSFLKGGDSMDSIDLLKMAGVDMTTPQPVRSALKKFEELVTELESLTEEN